MYNNLLNYYKDRIGEEGRKLQWPSRAIIHFLTNAVFNLQKYGL